MTGPLHATEAEKSPAMIKLDALVKERVLNGIEFLRKTYGEDWVEHIDMKTFQLSDGDCCVLGQVHPVYFPEDVEQDGWTDEGYEAAVEKFGWERAEPVAYGFLDDEKASFHRLQKEWETRIEDEKVSLERKKMAGVK